MSKHTFMRILGQFSLALVSGVLSSFLVTLVAYMYFRENILPVVARSAEILHLDDVMRDLDEIARTPEQPTPIRPEYGKSFTSQSQAAKTLLSSVSKRMESLGARCDELEHTLVDLAVVEPGRFRGQQVPDPKRRYQSMLATVRSDIDGIRQSLDQLSGRMAELDAAADDDRMHFGDVCIAIQDNLIQQQSTQRQKTIDRIRSIRLALKSRSDTMLNVLSEWGQ